MPKKQKSRKDDYWDTDEFLQDQELDAAAASKKSKKKANTNTNKKQQARAVDDDGDDGGEDQHDEAPNHGEAVDDVRHTSKAVEIDDDDDDDDDEGIIFTNDDDDAAAAANTTKAVDSNVDEDANVDAAQVLLSSELGERGQSTAEHEDPMRNYTYAELNACVARVREWIEHRLAKKKELPTTISSLASLLRIQSNLLELKHVVSVADVLELLLDSRIVRIEDPKGAKTLSFDLSNKTRTAFLSRLKEEPPNLAEVSKLCVKRLFELTTSASKQQRATDKTDQASSTTTASSASTAAKPAKPAKTTKAAKQQAESDAASSSATLPTTVGELIEFASSLATITIKVSPEDVIESLLEEEIISYDDEKTVASSKKGKAAPVEFIKYNQAAIESKREGGYTWKTYVMIIFMVMMIAPALLRNY